MGLKRTIKNAVEAGVAALGDIPDLCTYTQYGSGSYNASTGAITPSTTTQTSVPTVFDAYSTHDIDGERVRSTDQKVLIAANDLTLTPRVSDTITTPASVVWRVEDVATDPATACWVLQVRKP